MWKSSTREMLRRRTARHMTVAQATEEQRQVIFKRCIMTMNWSQEKYDCSTWSEREAEPPDEFSLQLNDRERTELLQLLEHSLPAATEGRKRSRDSEAIRRDLKERVRMFGA